MPVVTVGHMLTFANEAIRRVIETRDAAGAFGYALFGPMVAGDPGREILLLEITPEAWARYAEEDLTHCLPSPLPGRLFLTSMSRREFEELSRAQDPRVLAMAAGYKVLRDPGRWLAPRLGALRRSLARTS